MVHSVVSAYTGCFRVNLPFSRSRFMRLNYIDITKNIYIRNLMVREIKSKERFTSEHSSTFIDY